jgi:transposase
MESTNLLTDGKIAQTVRKDLGLHGLKKIGNCYLRKILVHGARAVVLRSKRDRIAMGAWITSLEMRAPRNVLIVAVANKLGRIDARTLARLVRIDPQLLCPVKHRSVEAQADLTVIRARAALVRTRTMLVNAGRSLTKSYGERLRGCNAGGMQPKAAQDLSPELKSTGTDDERDRVVSERICEYDHLLESMTQNRYPEAERLKQIKGVGTLIALTYMLTLEDPHRFRKSRDAACYVGLQPGRCNSGQSEPQMHISKEAILTYEHFWQAAHHVLGPWESTATCADGA